MTAQYLRCDGCGKDFPPEASIYKDYYRLERDAKVEGWTISDHPSAYSRKHFCKECSDAHPLR